LLGQHLNLGTDNTKAERQSRLFVSGWCIAAMRPRPPYWIAAINGEQGTGKSTATRLLKRLVDPGGAEDSHPPKSPHDLAVVAAAQRVVALDNLSKVSLEMSDALARMATGSTIQNRALYTDAAVSFTRVEAAGVLNGISDFVVRPDLAERTLPITLSRPTHRRTEKRIYREFEQAHPHLLAVLCDGLSSVMAHVDDVEEELDPQRAPRMIDCYCWAIAAGKAWDWGPNEFLEAMNAAQTELAEAALDTPLHQALVSMLHKASEKTGYIHAKAGELQKLYLHECQNQEVSSKELEFVPRSGRGMSTLIRRCGCLGGRLNIRKMGPATTRPPGTGSLHLARLSSPKAANSRAKQPNNMPEIPCAGCRYVPKVPKVPNPPGWACWVHWALRCILKTRLEDDANRKGSAAETKARRSQRALAQCQQAQVFAP
jgi:hypothetical protein